MDAVTINEGIRKLGPWFHQIDLPGGILTKTENHFGEGADHPKPTWAKVRQGLPEDLTGKRVLDVGCNAGFYAFQAAARGAESVLGVDAVRWQVQQARFAAKALGVTNAHFERVSLYELDPAKHGTFDVVLALGLVYHLKHLVAGLERLFAVTSDLLIVESAVISPGVLGFTQTEPVPYAAEQLFVTAYSKNSPLIKESAFNWFFPTPAALQAMIEDVGFVEVKIVEVFDNRCVITARKPREVIDSRYPAYLRARIEAEKDCWEVPAGDTAQIPVRITNVGNALWRANEGAPQTASVGLVGQLFSDEDPVFGQQVFAHFPDNELPPGHAWDLLVAFKTPDLPGRYTLELDLVSEGLALFQDVGSAPLDLKLDVKG